MSEDVPVAEYLDPINDKLIVILVICLSLLSLVGSSFIIIVMIIFPELKSFAMKIVWYLQFADLLFSISNLMTIFHNFEIANNSFICQLQAFLHSFGGLSSIFWTTVISWSMFSTVVKDNRKIQSYETKFLYFAYGLPLLLSLIPFLTEDYGPAGGWCWISISKDTVKRSVLLMTLLFYIPLWAAIIINFIYYQKVSKFLKQFTNEELDFDSAQKKIMIFPRILIFCWIWASINRVYNFFGEDKFLFNILHIIFGCLQGFLNAIFYGINYEVRSAVKQRLSQKFPKIFGEFEKKELKESFFSYELQNIGCEFIEDGNNPIYNYQVNYQENQQRTTKIKSQKLRPKSFNLINYNKADIFFVKDSNSK